MTTRQHTNKEVCSDSSDDEPVVKKIEKEQMIKQPIVVLERISKEDISSQKITQNYRESRQRNAKNSCEEVQTEDLSLSHSDDEGVSAAMSASRMIKKTKGTNKRGSAKASPPTKRGGNRAKSRRRLSGNSSDDEPLINLVKTPAAQKQRKQTKRNDISKVPVSKESDDSSDNDDDDDDDDDEPLINLVKRPAERKQRKKPKRKNANLSGDNSDNEPLTKLTKKARAEKQSKKETISKKDAPKSKLAQRDMDSCDSSDNEPLINLVGKLNRSAETTDATERPTPTSEPATPTKDVSRETSPKTDRQKSVCPVINSEPDEKSKVSSDDEPLIKMV